MRHKTALVLGGADTLEADRAAALALFWPDLIIACNHAGRDEPHVDHWATMHPEQFPRWISDRRNKGHQPAGKLWAARHRILPNHVKAEPITSWGGSSGMLCAQVGLELGCTRIVLAGVPMVRNNCHYDSPQVWRDATNYRPAWERRKNEMIGKVRSMSGWTAQLLGVPDASWLDD